MPDRVRYAKTSSEKATFLSYLKEMPTNMEDLFFFGLRWGMMWELTRVLTKPGMFVKQIIILTSQSLIFNVLIWFVIVRIW
jgi:hypothetical protein